MHYDWSRCGSERPRARACRAAARRSTTDRDVPSPPTPSTSCVSCASLPSVTTLTHSRRRLRSTRRLAPQTGSRTGRCGLAAAHHGRTFARVPPPSGPRASERAPLRTPSPVSACDAFLRRKERRRQPLLLSGEIRVNLECSGGCVYDSYTQQPPFVGAFVDVKKER